MNLDELDKELEKPLTSPDRLIGPLQRRSASGFVPLCWPHTQSHVAVVENEETGRIERVSIPILPINYDPRDRVRRSYAPDAHLGGVEL